MTLNVLIASVLLVLAPEPKSPADYLVIREGALPIILTAPHGGRTVIDGALVRRGVGVEKFTTVLDGNTDALTLKIADRLEKKLGRKPSVVVARFARTYADANRPAADAYESDAAKPVYELFHKTVVEHRQAISKRHGGGLLVDIHGQGVEPNTIFRGTASGQSVKHLVDRHGLDALVGAKSLFGVLNQKGVVIHPAMGSKDREDRRFNGGYIVQTYGSADGGNFDAIQLEIGGNLRQAVKLDSTAEAIAEAITIFAQSYLQK
jgi:N-formylglutamate amidohydrolase